jgi:dihydroorotate dehydrogenase electron transfer subunit
MVALARQGKGKIISHVSHGREYREMAVAVDLQEAVPGQFANIKVSEGYEPLLRRPLSIYGQDLQAGTLHFLYRLVGQGTRLLSKRQVGEKIDLIAPLGRGFSLTGLTPETPALLVAGGVGAAPLYFLARQLKDRGVPVHFFLGGRRAEDLAFREKIAKGLETPLIITTEDGSLGKKGLITAALQEKLAGPGGGEGCRLFACGPPAMLREVARAARQNGQIPLQVSMEAVMACGFGACLGCVCPAGTRKGEETYKRVCTEGPVFAAGEVEL